MSKNIGCFQATRRKVTTAAAAADQHNGIIAVSRNLGCDGGGKKVNCGVDEFVTPLLTPCGGGGGGGKESASSMASSLQVCTVHTTQFQVF